MLNLNLNIISPLQQEKKNEDVRPEFRWSLTSLYDPGNGTFGAITGIATMSISAPNSNCINESTNTNGFFQTSDQFPLTASLTGSNFPVSASVTMSLTSVGISYDPLTPDQSYSASVQFSSSQISDNSYLITNKLQNTFLASEFFRWYVSGSIISFADLRVRFDPYSGSVVLAIPGTLFGTIFGQTSFAQDISSYIRNSGSSYPLLSTTGSGTLNSATASNFFNYNSSVQLTGSISQFITGSDPNFNFGGNTDFTMETWINYGKAQAANQSGPNTVIFYNQTEDEGGQVGFQTVQDLNRPGIRLVLVTNTGSNIVIDSADIGRDANEWYHFAAQRSGSLFSLLFNGTVVKDFIFSQGLFISSSVSTNQIFGRGEEATDGGFRRFQDYIIYKGIGKYPNATSQSLYTLPGSIVV